MLKDFFKKLSYDSGLLGLYHRMRNSGSLTVVMFHRTLTPDDPRWETCDPDYTLAVEWLERSLGFFRRHYNVVTLGQVLASRCDGVPLPKRALLITFDDGWADNAEHALPVLERHGLPGVMFVVSDAIGTRQPFYQERIIGAWRRGVISVAQLAGVLEPHGRQATVEPEEDILALRSVIGRLEALGVEARNAALAPFAQVLDDGLRHMVDVADLRKLQAGGVALGLHGKTHVPMTRATDIDEELAGARAALAGHIGQDEAGARAMSFPHGAHDRAIAERARSTGYDLVFTSVPVLNCTRPSVGWLLGRTGYETSTVVDRSGRFRDDWLALYLFRQKARRLA